MLTNTSLTFINTIYESIIYNHIKLNMWTLCRYTISFKRKKKSLLVKFKNTLNHCICNNFEYNILTHI